VDGVKLGNITALLDNFGPALDTLDGSDGPRDSNNDKIVQKVAEANARMTAMSLTRRSPILQELVDAGNLTITAALHDINWSGLLAVITRLTSGLIPTFGARV